MGNLLPTAIVLVPGFVAWKTDQRIQPHESQKPTDAIVEILVFSFLNALLWCLWRAPTYWTDWPRNSGEIALLLAQMILSPITIAYILRWVIDYAALRRWITSPFPTAWDFVFNGYARRNALMALVTLSDGTRVAGAYVDPGHAALTPFDHDLFLSEVWNFDDEGFIEKIYASKGVLIERSDIVVVEFFDYMEIVNYANKRKQQMDER